jgi:hypothetical protein
MVVEEKEIAPVQLALAIGPLWATFGDKQGVLVLQAPLLTMTLLLDHTMIASSMMFKCGDP